MSIVVTAGTASGNWLQPFKAIGGLLPGDTALCFDNIRRARVDQGLATKMPASCRREPVPTFSLGEKTTLLLKLAQ
jgi:hypothetical protein